MNRLEVFIPVDEDWYGNYYIEDDQRYVGQRLVRLAYLLLALNPVIHRVCVWGNDDFGLEIDTPSYEDAMALFVTVVKTPRPTVRWLKSLGFQGA